MVNRPFPRTAPWFTYGPSLSPNGLWYVGYVTANGQLSLDCREPFPDEASATAFFKENDHGLEHAN